MGPTEARVGDIVPLTCTTAPSNPPAEIKWMVGGRQVRNATSKTIVSPEGKWCQLLAPGFQLPATSYQLPVSS